MPAELTRFCVVGLHGRQTMDVEIQDNKLILVGENGTGKSTFANLIYYFLTMQWERLREYRFEAIEAILGGDKLTVTPEQIQAQLTARQRMNVVMRRYIGPSRRRQMREIVEHTFYGMREGKEAVFRLSQELGIPVRMAHELMNEVLKEGKKGRTELEATSEKISSAVKGQFLFLPTYRRIEQDLKSIFGGEEFESGLHKVRERLTTKREGVPFIELVEFGMEDVEETISNRMNQIKESVRTGLDNLTGTYLRDVIRGVHTTVDVQVVRDIDPKALDAIFARIEETTLPAEDKTRLKERVATISARPEIEDEDKVIAHFLRKLIRLYMDQQASEKDVREFVDLCNRYLSGKQIIYDNTKYRIYIRLESQIDTTQESLEMKFLSSGEKQIVSLFSHLYLSGEKHFFVIIDEPELSLSVPWQKGFLPDIVETGMCTGLIAVTHSPFVWENNLEPYVRSLAEFTRPYHVVR